MQEPWTCKSSHRHHLFLLDRLARSDDDFHCGVTSSLRLSLGEKVKSREYDPDYQAAYKSPKRFHVVLFVGVPAVIVAVTASPIGSNLENAASMVFTLS